ncbi:PQQ-dependent sugar dehydrogenase [Haloactinomyces albus]|uniref:Glucose/arabinose dehydrogenase n=1 Tax=Haloactinomyces albus TaxID=1352928 RepID=A0AAE3Z9G2_9ACTN|nr:PQQ-dependent sugar dehydrogenase [Haloactinomyces albus]MDR7300783.1 glucose/arabinose dehydrogenase [Haloactinomyces albus]
MAASSPSPRPSHGAVRRGRLLGAALIAGTLVAGCAQFPDDHSGTWHEQPSLKPQAGPQPHIEGRTPPPPRSSSPGKPPPPPQGCEDPDPAVVATCLEPVGALVVLPRGQGVLVGERETGRVLHVREDREPVEIAHIPVEPVGGGGLTGLALSPSYAEDQLVYAYVTTPTDNRVVRIAAGDPPEPILAGIPRGPTGNSGAITTDGKGALLVATGDAGSPDKAADATSLAGKVLRINAFGQPAAGNPTPGSPIVSSGLTAPGGLCAAPRGAAYWVTDHGSDPEALYRVQPGQPLGTPDWTWQDRPGVSGCATAPGMVVVALSDVPAVYTMRPTPQGGFSGQPQKAMVDTYGRFSAAALGPKGLLWLGTVNRDGGNPVSSDDRVIRVKPPAGSTAGKD